jgi:hypothetical protein
VAATVPDIRQGVVLGEECDGGRAASGCRAERGLNLADAALDIEAPTLQRVGEQAARVPLLKVQFGVRVDLT